MLSDSKKVFVGFKGGFQGGLAVEGFFLVSGFVMALAYSTKDFVGDGAGDGAAAAERRDFWAKRFARLAPLYYATEVAAYFIYEENENDDEDGWSVFRWATSLTATTSWFNIPRWDEDPRLWEHDDWKHELWQQFPLYPYNGVLWSVSTIASFSVEG